VTTLLTTLISAGGVVFIGIVLAALLVALFLLLARLLPSLLLILPGFLLAGALLTLIAILIVVHARFLMRLVFPAMTQPALGRIVPNVPKLRNAVSDQEQRLMRRAPKSIFAQGECLK
jgi:hypothetical protein